MKHLNSALYLAAILLYAVSLPMLAIPSENKDTIQALHNLFSGKKKMPVHSQNNEQEPGLQRKIDALHALQAYHLKTDDESVNNLADAVTMQETKSIEPKRKTRDEDTTVLARITSKSTTRFNQQKEIEQRLWHYLARIPFALDRVKAGRGLDDDILSLYSLLQDYYKNFPYHDELLISLIEQALTDFKTLLTSTLEKQDQQCETAKAKLKNVILAKQISNTDALDAAMLAISQYCHNKNDNELNELLEYVHTTQQDSQPTMATMVREKLMYWYARYFSYDTKILQRGKKN